MFGAHELREGANPPGSHLSSSTSRGRPPGMSMVLVVGRGIFIPKLRPRLGYRSARKCSSVSPASRTIPAIVYPFMGSWRGNRDRPGTIGHHDVLPLAYCPKTCFLQGSHCPFVGNTRKSRARLDRNLYFANFAAGKLLVKSLKVLVYCRSDVVDRFGLRIALRPASRQTGAPDVIAFFRFLQCHIVRHRLNLILAKARIAAG
jgi:hypothetical protein